MPSKQRMSVLCLCVGGTLSASLTSDTSDVGEGGKNASWSSGAITVETFVSLRVGELAREVAI